MRASCTPAGSAPATTPRWQQRHRVRPDACLRRGRSCCRPTAPSPTSPGVSRPGRAARWCAVAARPAGQGVGGVSRPGRRRRLHHRLRRGPLDPARGGVDNVGPMPVLEAAFARFTSRQENSPSLQMVPALRGWKFGGHAVVRFRISPPRRPHGPPRPSPGPRGRPAWRPVCVRPGGDGSTGQEPPSRSRNQVRQSAPAVGTSGPGSIDPPTMLAGAGPGCTVASRPSWATRSRTRSTSRSARGSGELAIPGSWIWRRGRPGPGDLGGVHRLGRHVHDLDALPPAGQRALQHLARELVELRGAQHPGAGRLLPGRPLVGQGGDVPVVVLDRDRRRRSTAPPSAGRRPRRPATARLCATVVKNSRADARSIRFGRVTSTTASTPANALATASASRSAHAVGATQPHHLVARRLRQAAHLGTDHSGCFLPPRSACLHTLTGETGCRP